jgi:hypothetical protein
MLFFDIRIKIDDDIIIIKQNKEISIHNNKETIEEKSKNNIILDTDDEINHDKFENTTSNYYKR